MQNIKIMIVSLKVLVDVISKPDKHGNTKVLKKDQEYLKQFDSTKIMVEQYISERGAISKKYCLIKDDGIYYKLNHSFDEICKLNSHIRVGGFKS